MPLFYAGRDVTKATMVALRILASVVHMSAILWQDECFRLSALFKRIVREMCVSLFLTFSLMAREWYCVVRCVWAFPCRCAHLSPKWW